jgi:hypothetical protein
VIYFNCHLSNQGNQTGCKNGTLSLFYADDIKNGKDDKSHKGFKPIILFISPFFESSLLHLSE